MADLEKTVAIVFSGKDLDFGSSIENISVGMDKFDKQLVKIGDPLANFGDKILKLDAAVAALAIGSLALVVKKAADFDESFDAVSMRISGTTEDIDKFRDQVLLYGQDSTKSLLDINSAVSQAIQKGINYQDALGTVSIAEKLSVAGRGDLKSATELLTTVMNAYGASTSEAGRYSDVFMQAIKQGAGSIPDLASGLGKVSGLAAAAGVPIETVTAAIAALGAQGIPTDTAIQGLTRTIANLLDPSTEARALAAKLGLQFDATALSTQGLETVLKNAYTATKGNAEQMKTLFGSVKGLTVAVDLAADSHGKFKTALEATRNAAGATNAIFEREKDDLENVAQTIKNNVDAVLIDIGMKLLPQVGKLGSSLADVFKGVKIGIDSGSLAPVTDFINKSGADLTRALEQIAKALPEAFKKIDWSGLVGSLKSLGTAINEAFIGKEVNPDKLAAAIQNVIDTISSLIDLTHGIGEALMPFASAVVTIVEGFNKLSPDTKQQLGDVLGIAMGFKLFGPVWGTIMLAMGADAEDASKIIRFAFNAIDNGMNALKVAVISLGLIFASAAQDAAQLLDYVPGYDASADIARTSDRVKILSAALQDAEAKFDKSTMALLSTGTAADSLGKSATSAADKAGNLGQALKDIPGSASTKITLDTKEFEDWKIKYLADSKAFNLSLKAIPDAQSFSDTENTIKSKFGGSKMVTITTNLDGTTTIESINKFNSAFPADKKVEIKPDITQTALADIKSKSEIIQKSIEWKAKIDIAQIEAATKVMETAFKSVDNTITDTGKVLTDLAGTYATLVQSGSYGSYFLERMIQAENVRRDQALKMQEDLVKSQVKNLDARTAAMKSGQAMITIDGKGLQPQLEAFMFEVLKAIQVKANAEGAQYLVGI